MDELEVSGRFLVSGDVGRPQRLGRLVSSVGEEIICVDIGRLTGLGPSTSKDSGDEYILTQSENECHDKPNYHHQTTPPASSKASRKYTCVAFGCSPDKMMRLATPDGTTSRRNASVECWPAMLVSSAGVVNAVVYQ